MWIWIPTPNFDLKNRPNTWTQTKIYPQVSRSPKVVQETTFFVQVLQWLNEPNRNPSEHFFFPFMFCVSNCSSQMFLHIMTQRSETNLSVKIIGDFFLLC